MAEPTSTSVVTRTRDIAAVPFRRNQPHAMRSDLLTPDLCPTDDRMWAPLDNGAWSRPLTVDVPDGAYVHVMRAMRQGLIARHRHTGTVDAMVPRGRWHYLEHDWVVTEASLALEPPGQTRTLVVPDGCQEMVALLIVTGALIYVDPDSLPIGYDNVFSRLSLTRQRYARVELEAAQIDALVR